MDGMSYLSSYIKLYDINATDMIILLQTLTAQVYQQLQLSL